MILYLANYMGLQKQREWFYFFLKFHVTIQILYLKTDRASKDEHLTYENQLLPNQNPLMCL